MCTYPLEFIVKIIKINIIFAFMNYIYKCMYRFLGCVYALFKDCLLKVDEVLLT